MSGKGVTLILDRKIQQEILKNVSSGGGFIDGGGGEAWLAWPLPLLAALLVFFVVLSCAGTFVIAVKIYRIKYLQVLYSVRTRIIAAAVST